MAVHTVTQNTPASIQAIQIGASFNDFLTVFPALAGAAYQCSILCLPPPTSGGAVTWQVTLVKPNYPAQVGTINDWITFDGTHAQIVPAAQFSSEYTQTS